MRSPLGPAGGIGRKRQGLWPDRRRGHRLRTRLAAVAVLVAGTFSLPPGPSAFAAQSGWSGATGEHGTGCKVNEADNSSNSWFGYYLQSQTTSALHWTVTYIANETKVVEIGVSTHDSNTDVIYNDGDYANQSGAPCVGSNNWWPNGGTFGYTACWSLTSWNGCQQHRIYVDTAWEYDSSNTPGWDQALMLHESGHGLGLTHPSSPVAGEVMSYPQSEVDYYSNNDKTLIQYGLPD